MKRPTSRKGHRPEEVVAKLRQADESLVKGVPIAEVARRPQRCVEYLLVHELVHLLEAKHGPKFVAIMDQHLPSWRRLRSLLNDGPLAHQNWSY